MAEKIQCLIRGAVMDVDADSLVKLTGFDENDNETCNWVEYRLDGELVHRSAHVHLKQGLGSLSSQGTF